MTLAPRISTMTTIDIMDEISRFYNLDASDMFIFEDETVRLAELEEEYEKRVA